MLAHFALFIMHIIQSVGYMGVAILMLLTSCLMPIPSEITLPFAGFLANQGQFNLGWVIVVAIVGDLLGTLLAYAIGFYLEETVALNLIKKYGKYCLISIDEYERMRGWFRVHGSVIIVLSKILPGFRTIIGLLAGLSEAPLKKVILCTLLGSSIWCTILTTIGFTLGAHWDRLEPIFRKFELMIVLALVLGAVVYLNHKLKFLKLK